MGGVLLTVAAVPAVLASPRIIAGMAGAAAAAKLTDEYVVKAHGQTLSRVFNQDFELSCRQDHVELLNKDGSRVTIDKGNISASDSKGQAILRNEMTLDQLSGYGELLSCRSKEDAKKTKATILVAREKWQNDSKASQVGSKWKKTLGEALGHSSTGTR